MPYSAGEEKAPKIPWFKREPLRQHAPARFLLAAFATLAAVILQVVFKEIVEVAVFLFYYPVIFLVAWFLGFWPAVLSTILAIIATDFVLFEPAYKFVVLSRTQLIRLSVFALVGILVSWLTARSRRTEAHLRASKAELEKSERRFTLATEASNVGIFDWEIRTGRLTWTDPLLKLWGYSTGEFTQTMDAFWKKVVPSDRDLIQKAVNEAFSERKEFFAQYRIEPREQDQRWVIARGKPFFDENGNAVRLMGTAADITERKKIEDELRYQLALNRGITGQAAQSIFVLDMEGRVTYCNSEAERIFGYSHDELMGQILHDKIHYRFPDGRHYPATECPLARAYTHGETLRGQEDVFFTKDGKLVYVSFSNGPLEVQSQRVGSVLLVGDTTARKLLQIERDHFYELPNHLLCIVDANECFVSLNQGYVDVLGFKKEELVGRSIWDFIHPDDIESVKNATEKLHRGPLRAFESRHRAKDGTYHWLQWAASYLDGRTYGAAIDITERKEAERHIQESEIRFRAMAENISQLAWMADETGKIFWYNKRWYEYTGTTPEEMQQKGWKSIPHPDHLDRVVKSITHSFETGKPWDDTFPMRDAHGNYRWFLSRAVPIKNDKGEVIRWFGTNTDITEQMNTEERLREAVRTRDEFLSIASHELKTPLTTLKLQSQMRERNLCRGNMAAFSPEKLQTMIASDNRHLDRLIRLVDDMLDVSRINSGRLSIEKETFDFCKLIAETVEQYKSQCKQAGCTISMNLECPLEGYWDRSRMAQVLNNLISNAIKYGAGTPITITANKHDGSFEVRVRDEGRGIPREDQERIFRRFERGVSATEISGLGLGLYIVRKIMELHGGTISVDSAPGKGSTFIIKLPPRREDSKE